MLFVDLDGTILDDHQRHYAAYTQVLAMSDVKGVPIPEKEYWEWKTRNKPVDDLIKRSRVFPTKHKLYKERFEQMLETEELLELDDLRSGTETFLGKVHTKTPIVLVTQRRDPDALETQLSFLGIRDYFVTVLSGAPPANRRPRRGERGKHKASLIKARYKLPPTEAVYLGDTETDVEAAKDLGYECFLVEGGHRRKELLLKAKPDRIIANLPAALPHILPGGRWQR